MADDDLRKLIDPLAAVVAARPRWRTIPGFTYTPPGTEAEPDPAPVTVPERSEAYVDPAELPHELISDGAVSLNEQVALLHAAVAQIFGDIEIRSVSGSVVVSSVPPGLGPTWDGGESATVPVTWSSPPLRLPAHADVEVSAPIALLDRTAGEVVPGSITMQGCTVRIRNISAVPVVPTVATALAFTVRALYLYLPPFQESP